MTTKDSSIIEMSMVITKAHSLPDGSRRWQAVTSDTERDRTGQATSIELFHDWIERAEKGIVTDWIPDPPRNPFLGLSHYPSLDGFGEAGPTEQMYIDGNRFKASGQFADNPLGKALFEAIQTEGELIQKGEAIEEPIRISAAWYDIAHRHGDFVFKRKGLNHQCPICEQGQTDQTYLQGQLDHFAATRVPINPRTSLALEEKSDMSAKTRKEDAASIIDEELAEKLDKEAKLTGKSEAMIIKAAMKTVDGKKYPAGDFLVAEDKEKPNTWHLQVKRNGEPNHNLMGAAWAALHEGYRGNKYEGPMKAEALSKLKSLYKSEEMEMPKVKKAEMKDKEADQEDEEEDEDEEKKMTGKAGLSSEFEIDQLAHYQQMVEKYGEEFCAQMYKSEAMTERMYEQGMGIANGEEDGYLPFGGALSMQEAMDYIKAHEMQGQSRARYDVYNAVIDNIMEFVTDPAEMIKLFKEANNALAGELKAIKAALSDAWLAEDIITERGETMTTPNNQEQTSDMFAKAREAYDAALLIEDPQERKAAVQRSMASLYRNVEQDYNAQAGNVAEIARAAVQEAIAPITEQLGLIAAKLGQPQSQAAVDVGALPVQKSFAPGQVRPDDNGGLPVSPVLGKPSALTAQIRRSVGLAQ